MDLDSLVDEQNPITFGGLVSGATAKASSNLANRRGDRFIALLTLAICALLPLFLVCKAAAEAQDTFEDGRRAYDYDEFYAAKAIWTALAQAGDARSQASLGYLYREGKGVTQNSKAAAYWYYQAALRGDPTAQSALCDMHLKGEGVRRDLQAALLWCELSIEGGETSGIELRERALNRMTTEQRDEAWTMIAKWRALQKDKTCCDLTTEPPAATAGVSENPEPSMSKQSSNERQGHRNLGLTRAAVSFSIDTVGRALCGI
jgi:TPR repeat protein